jgi:hypothetical protein
MSESESVRALRWWQAWFIAGAAAIVLPLPWSIVVAAPFALWAGWHLIDQPPYECGWCGRRFGGEYDWCCPTCAKLDLP